MTSLQDAERWIALDGAVNVRDMGGLPLRDGGATQARRLVRADNLQDLTQADMRYLREEIGVRDVIDLRTTSERQVEGPGPLEHEPEVRVLHWSLLPEAGDQAREVDGDILMPWQAGPDEVPAPERQTRGVYVSYLRDRPDSVVGALRNVAHSDGAVVVHCEAILADYLLTAERIDAIIARLSNARAYASNLRERPRDSHLPRAEGLQEVLAYVDEGGGTESWLRAHGWGQEDTAALRTRLRGEGS